MICFAVALRSPKSTSNWEGVLKDFNNTIHSIFNQTNPDFRVYVGCNEIPEMDRNYDERLRFVLADTPVPKTWQECCRDRSWKLCLCAQQIRKDMDQISVRGGGAFVFPVDADDYVHRGIAQYVCDHPEANGFKSKTGYRWVKGSKIATITKYFGGSMNIMKMYPEDLPDTLPDISMCFDKATSMELNRRYPIRWYDIEVEAQFAALGKPPSRLPFRSTIYVLGTGSNISSNDPAHVKEDKRFHPVAFLRKMNPFGKKVISPTLKATFGMRY